MILGVVVFLLFFIYDINDLKIKNRIIQKFFLIGAILLVCTTLWILYPFEKVEWIWLVLACFFCILLIYTLFFALPFETTYVDSQRGRKVYSEGVYGICRHPGIWWFLFMYICLGFAFPNSKIMGFGIMCSCLNFLYACFQDVYVFPRIFIDYDEYKQKVPFLIPRRSSHEISR